MRITDYPGDSRKVRNFFRGALGIAAGNQNLAGRIFAMGSVGWQPVRHGLPRQ